MRVLVIEDDQEMAEAVATGLRHSQITTDVALDGSSGLSRALVNDYDVIVLDRDLPGLHGDEVCARLTAEGTRSRVLMLTAAATSEDLVDGLWLGADDYLPKPFDFPVLLARIGALFRRAQPAMSVGDLKSFRFTGIRIRAHKDRNQLTVDFHALNQSVEIRIARRGNSVGDKGTVEERRIKLDHPRAFGDLLLQNPAALGIRVE